VTAKGAETQVASKGRPSASPAACPRVHAYSSTAAHCAPAPFPQNRLRVVTTVQLKMSAPRPLPRPRGGGSRLVRARRTATDRIPTRQAAEMSAYSDGLASLHNTAAAAQVAADRALPSWRGRHRWAEHRHRRLQQGMHRRSTGMRREFDLKEGKLYVISTTKIVVDSNQRYL